MYKDKNLIQADPLKCYSCNSQYQRCGIDNFDSSVYSASYCYGTCLKINVNPGNFIIRACSTFLENSLFWSNSSVALSTYSPQQCYIANVFDLQSSSIKSSYICVCNDKNGCNFGTRKKSSYLHLLTLTLFLTIFYL